MEPGIPGIVRRGGRYLGTRRLGSSRALLNRLLDPEKNDKVQLYTVQRAAAAIGRRMRMELA
jgi:hypothetical protein